MLQRMRDKAQGWFAWLILGAIAFTFVLFGTSSYFGDNGPNEWVAKVNGKAITERELEIAYQRFLQQPGSEGVRQLDPEYIKTELLQSLIEQQVILQDASNIGMTVSTEQVSDMIRSVPFFKDESGQFSEEAYLRFLATSNYTDQSFRTLLHDSIITGQLQNSIVHTAFALPSELNDFAKFLLQTRGIRYFVIPKSTVESEVTVSEDEIKAYYEKNLNKFKTPEKVSLEYLQLSLADLMGKVTYTDQNLQEFYRDNLSAFTYPASAKVAHILINTTKEADPKTHEAAKAKMADIQKELKAGKSFSDLAKQYSEDRMSAEKGGDLQWFTAGEMVPQFEKAALALEPGQVSDVVQTDYGYHLIKLVEKKPEVVRKFVDAKSDVITKYKQYQAEEALSQKVDELAQLVFDTPDTLQPAAEKIEKPLQKTELFTQEQGPQHPVLNRNDVVLAAFSANVKDDKNNSDLIKVDDQNYIVFRLAELVPSQQKPLETVSAEIKQTLLVEKESTALKEKAKNIETALLDTKTLADDKVLEQHQWTTKENVGRTTRGVDAELLEAAFSMPKPLANKRVIKTTPLANGDYAVVWLFDVKDGNPAMLNSADKQNYESALSKHWGELEFALYTTELMDEAKVVKP